MFLLLSRCRRRDMFRRNPHPWIRCSSLDEMSVLRNVHNDCARGKTKSPATTASGQTQHMSACHRHCYRMFPTMSLREKDQHWFQAKSLTRQSNQSWSLPILVGFSPAAEETSQTTTDCCRQTASERAGTEGGYLSVLMVYQSHVKKDFIFN